jgi:hypothetical protein
MNTIRRCLIVAIVGVFIALAVAAWVALSSHSGDEVVPLDRFSRYRLAVLRGMSACAGNPGEDIVAGGDTMYICNDRGLMLARDPELPPLPTQPATLPAPEVFRR